MDDNVDWYEKLTARIQDENVERFPKPAKWNRKGCEKSTEIFARCRLHYFAEMADEIDPERKLFNPILDYFVKEYPLPIGLSAISQCYTRNGWDDGPREIIPSPFVERLDAYAGLAKRFTSGDTVGWFLGLVKPYNLFTVSEEEFESLPDEEKFYWAHHMEFIFIDGIVLLEGKLDDDLVNIPLKEYIKYYNKNILGKVVTGRPFSKETDSIIEAAKIAIKEHPLDKQLMIAIEIGYPERTLQFHIKRSKYKNWKGLHDSVINNE